MASYDWLEWQGRSWLDRFPGDVRGYAAWREQRLKPRLDFKALEASVKRAREETTTRPSQPCLFVSHRRADHAQARRMAYLACREGFDYWLDIVDPSLSAATAEQTAAAVAAIIEMGLLNSTHVIAAITTNTKGSQWVPYEYGRVKTPQQPTSLQAACWADPTIASRDLPEYLYLGLIHRSESEIETWLRTEWRRYPGSKRTGPCGWKGAIPSPL